MSNIYPSILEKLAALNIDIYHYEDSTTSRMLIYQRPLHIYKTKIPPSSGSK